jgi:hypothetical protein
MKTLLEDFNAKVRRGNFFKPTIGSDSLYQDINDNVVRVVKLPHQNIWLLESYVPAPKHS